MQNFVCIYRVFPTPKTYFYLYGKWGKSIFRKDPHNLQIMKVTFYGHACFAVEFEDSTLLFDPFIRPNELASHIDVNSLSPDYILISHGHMDHIADAEEIAKRSGATIISNFEIIEWFGAKGLENGHPMNHGGAYDFPFGNVQYVTAIHSSVLPDGSYGGNPGGFVINTSEGCFYFAGDTALTMDMKLIGERHQLDFALLPIGDNFTMGVDDAVRCCDFIRCKKVIGLHYDTFPYIVIDKEEAQNKFTDAGAKLLLPEIGESIEI